MGAFMMTFQPHTFALAFRPHFSVHSSTVSSFLRATWIQPHLEQVVYGVVESMTENELGFNKVKKCYNTSSYAARE